MEALCSYSRNLSLRGREQCSTWILQLKVWHICQHGFCEAVKRSSFCLCCTSLWNESKSLLLLQQKAGWGCSGNKLCQVLLVGNSSHLVKLGSASCCFQLHGLEVMMGSKCHFYARSDRRGQQFIKPSSLKAFQNKQMTLNSFCDWICVRNLSMLY